ncbi:hypothetical protein HDV00_006949 [Rhizophlyctis rosea]|nr:hypothetical protein HDV00_006949 [Rhizophlyctis rosea]
MGEVQLAQQLYNLGLLHLHHFIEYKQIDAKHLEANPFDLRVLEGRASTRNELKRNRSEDLKNAEPLLRQLAAVKGELGIDEEAQELHIRLVEGKREQLGISNRELLDYIGRVPGTRGTAEAMEKMFGTFMEGVEIATRTLGDHHWHTRAFRKRLADVHCNSGNYGVAERLYLECIEGAKRDGSKNDAMAVQAMHSLGRLYMWVGEYGSAQRYLQKGAKVAKRKFGHLLEEYQDSLDELSEKLGDDSRDSFVGSWLRKVTVFGEAAETRTLRVREAQKIVLEGSGRISIVLLRGMLEVATIEWSNIEEVGSIEW